MCLTFVMYLYVPVYLILQLPNWISWNEPIKFLQEKHTGSGQLQRRARCSEGVQSAGRVGRLPLKPSRSGCCWSGLPHCNHTFLEVTAGCSIQVNCLWGSICFALASYKYYIYMYVFDNSRCHWKPLCVAYVLQVVGHLTPILDAQIAKYSALVLFSHPGVC